MALFTALATQNPLVAWELHSLCYHMPDVLQLSNVGHLVKFIREETGEAVLRRVCRLYNRWKPEGNDPCLSYWLGCSLNLTGLYAQRSESIIRCGKAIRLWYRLTQNNGRARWFGPRRGKTARQTAPGSTRKKLLKCLEDNARERNAKGGPEVRWR